MSVIILGIDLAVYVIDGEQPIYTVPIHLKRGPKRSEVPDGQPAKKNIIRRFIQKVNRDRTIAAIGSCAAAPQLPATSKFGGWPANILYTWVTCTKFVRRLKYMPMAQRACAKLLDDELGETALARIDQRREVHHDTLRKARCKF